MLAAVTGGNRKTWQILLPTFQFGSNIIQTYDYNGIPVDLIESTDTTWCGKVGYADNNVNEPNVEKIMEDFISVSALPNSREDNWDVCLSLNYLSCERPSGVIFEFLSKTDVQSDSSDIYKMPAAKFLRIRMCNETAEALGHEPWEGGVPPYHWLGEQIAPRFGCTYGCSTIPIVEYYGFYQPEEGTHEYCYLYVPVKENNDMAE